MNGHVGHVRDGCVRSTGGHLGDVDGAVCRDVGVSRATPYPDIECSGSCTL